MAECTPLAIVDAFTIQGAMRSPGRGTLDPITVILQDHGDNRGTLIVTCYGQAWTCYWGSMGGTLRHFIAGMDEHYTANCLIRGRCHTNRQRQQREYEYLTDIMKAVINEVKKESK